MRLNWIFWGLLVIWELLQLISKALAKKLSEYFSWQNMLEVLMLSGAFFVVEFLGASEIVFSLLNQS